MYISRILLRYLMKNRFPEGHPYALFRDIIDPLSPDTSHDINITNKYKDFNKLDNFKSMHSPAPHPVAESGLLYNPAKFAVVQRQKRKSRR
jgi:hypothetical protein